MDRCALFVDAGYVLGDGALAVHGTRNRDSVSWDYAGILRVLGNVARDRTGLPLLRCYWYEATVEGRRTPEHEALADVPGVKLRLGRMRPGRREGVESEIHRDLTTLARNRAISDALIVSAEEDLAQVIADVQDLGIRVILVHIPVAGSWTVSPALRQECDDLVEISAAHLRPTVELVVGAEPVEDPHAVSAYAGRAPANGHGPPGALAHRQALPVGAHAAPPAIYTGPVIAEYQRAAQPAISQPAISQPAAVAQPSGPAAAPPAAAQPGPAFPPMAPAQPGPVPQPQAVAQPVMPPGVPGQSAGQAPAPAAMQPVPGLPQQGPPGPRIAGHHAAPAPAQPDSAIPVSHGHHALAQQAVPSAQPRPPAAAQQFQPPTQPGPPAAAQQFQPPGPMPGPQGLQPVPAYEAAPPAPAGFRGQGPDLVTGPAPTGIRPAPQPAPPGQVPGAPAGQVPGAPAGQPVAGATVQHAQQFRGAPRPYQPGAPGPAGPPDPRAAQQFQAEPGAYVPQQGPHSGPQPTAQHAPVPQPVAVSLADAVQAAHGEGFNFGQAVARDAPALWLEAVLARKPRMPSDLEARLLQDSSLPIDSLLHDEVRHALRRGFWDALERVRH